MRARRTAALGAAIFVLPLLAVRAEAQVTRIDLKVVESPALDGRSFGSVGQYERLRGIAYGEVDPGDRRNRGIVDIENAPRNARGHVEYSTTVEIYRPIDMSRWNRALYYTVSNRGGAGAGEPALLERGFALVRVGWQGDLQPTDRNIVPFLPVAHRQDGSPIVGPALEEFIFNDDAKVSEGHLTYPAASLDPSKATLTVRRTQDGARSTPADLTWSYAGAQQIRIDRPSGFDGGAIYEFVYQAKDPIVMGLGFAAQRDVMSFLRYETADGQGDPNPLAFQGLPSVSIGFGISQSGRFLRDFLYRGFNEDMQGRIVFDGMHADIAGSRKTFTDFRFSQPGRWQKQHEDHEYPGDQFPFTYVTMKDPISGRTDGILEKCSETDTCPKLIHSDGEYEVWGARASLIVTDPRGHGIQLPDNVRVFVYAGTQHGGGPGALAGNPRTGICQNLNDPMSLREVRTALTVDLYQWVAKGVAPPDSRFPTVGNGGLVPPKDVAYPHMPGLTFTGIYNELRLHDFSTLPPKDGPAYTVLVGRVDEDGNMVDGVRHPLLEAPIGTYTGWNLRRSGYAEGEQCAQNGSFIPFAKTKAERVASGDPRLSIEERYPTHEVYVNKVKAAAEKLVRDRLLLQDDADEIIERAEDSSIGRPARETDR